MSSGWELSIFNRFRSSNVVYFNKVPLMPIHDKSIFRNSVTVLFTGLATCSVMLLRSISADEITWDKLRSWSKFLKGIIQSSRDTNKRFWQIKLSLEFGFSIYKESTSFEPQLVRLKFNRWTGSVKHGIVQFLVLSTWTFHCSIGKFQIKTVLPLNIMTLI